MCIYSVLKNKIHFEWDGPTMQNMEILFRRWTGYEGVESLMKSIYFRYPSTPTFAIY